MSEATRVLVCADCGASWRVPSSPLPMRDPSYCALCLSADVRSRVEASAPLPTVDPFKPHMLERGV